MRSLILRVSFLFVVCTSMLSCSLFNRGEGNGFGVYGDTTITEDGAILASEIPNRLRDADSIPLKIRGEINAVCQAKGCWMRMPLNEKESMTVRFKDYQFFVPKNSKGHEVVIEGVAFIETISVAQLQHEAEDEELSADEIAKITEPEVQYSFLATGVIIN